MSLFTNQVFPVHMGANSQFPTIHIENETDEHREYKGHKFMFVSYCPKEKIWHTSPNRFLLHKNSSTISGQFITSNWFNKEYLKYDDAYFVVVAVEKNMSAAKIEKDFNKLKNPFPTVYDIPPYIKIASYFKFGFDLICKFIHQTQKCEDSFEFTVRGTNNPWSTLTIKINKNAGSNKESILMCHPTFDMPLF
jgi:hypothetical protein